MTSLKAWFGRELVDFGRGEFLGEVTRVGVRAGEEWPEVFGKSGLLVGELSPSEFKFDDEFGLDRSGVVKKTKKE